MSLTLAFVAVLGFQNAADTGYKLPPQVVVDLLDARPTPTPRLSPNGRWMALLERPAMPSIEAVARPYVSLAGSRVDAKTNARKTEDFTDRITIRDLVGKTSFVLDLGEPTRVVSLAWSPSNDRFMVIQASSDAWKVRAVDLATHKVTACDAKLNPLFVGPRWLGDGKTILLAIDSATRGPYPEVPARPLGPSIQETGGEVSPTRTYQDLLKTPYDEALFDWFSTSQLATFDATTGTLTKIGPESRYASADASPNSQYLLVARFERPYSYLQPANAFGNTVEVWDRSGKMLREIAKIPLEENIPIEGVPLGPRNISWQNSADATLVWWEALDGGDPKRKVPHRDRLLSLSAPFTGDAAERLKLEHRARGLTWFQDPTWVAASDFDRDRRWTRTRLFDLDDPSKPVAVLDDRSQNDRYGNPGALVLDENAHGEPVVRQDGNFVYRMGEGESKEGARPFLDRFDLTTAKTERLWQCAPNTYESLVAMLESGADRKPTVVTSLEAKEIQPNLQLRNLDADSQTALTNFPDPQPQLRGITKQLIRYKRADGVDLSATLYLPKDHRPGEKLPVFVWAYPLEYTDSATAGQVSGSEHRFTRVGGASQLLLLTQGYAVLDNATMPIVGDPETMNDTFLEQIIAASEAALAEVDRLGVGDRERAAVGGHSYGAFMTANLLAHCDLFRTGIARSGAYNRTLTPFGFQSERRDLWDAKDVYLKVSPFMFADQINEPILMIHGQADSNPGTFPIQSERLFQAIKGHGGKARFVYLPAEDHGYRARESNLHVVAEMIEWLDKYVKNAKPRTVSEGKGG